LAAVEVPGLFEGGIRIPAMISWRGHLPQGQVRDQLISGCDWLATLAELCAVQLPADDVLDGKSMTPVIKDPMAPTAHPVLFWQTENHEWAVREGNWKLIGNPIDPGHNGPLPKSDALFLSNLDQDLSERANLAAANPGMVKHLLQMHDEWTAKTAAEMSGRGQITTAPVERD
jgi:arylsulfatase A